jgi:hypothetical protein
MQAQNSPNIAGVGAPVHNPMMEGTKNLPSNPLSPADQTKLFADGKAAARPEMVIEGTSWDGESFTHPITKSHKNPTSAESSTSSPPGSAPRMSARISVEDLFCGDGDGKRKESLPADDIDTADSTAAATVEAISGYSEL